MRQQIKLLDQGFILQSRKSSLTEIRLKMRMLGRWTLYISKVQRDMFCREL